MRFHKIVFLATVFALAVGAACPVAAGSILGRYYKPLYSDYYDPPPFYQYSYETIFKGIAGVGVSACREGSNIGVLDSAASSETATGEPVGYYELQNLAPGTYGVIFHEFDQWGPRLLFGKVVPNTSPNQLRLYPYVKYQDVTHGMAWNVLPAGTWSQTFVAKGNWVTQVGLHQTMEFGPKVEVSIHDGSPDGPQIGPARTVPTDVVNPSSVFWSAGEVPTTPGHTYSVNFFVPTGFIPYQAGARIQGGVAYPDGQVYKDGQLVTAAMTDWGYMDLGAIECTIYQDTDGYTSVVNTSKYNKGRDRFLVKHSGVTVAGQTFRAMGTSLLSFSCLVENTGSGLFIVTIYRSPGADGEGENQVGVAKYIQQKTTIPWARVGCIWKPNEVPLTAGQDYYLKIKRDNGAPFDIWCTNVDEYASGSYYENGVATAVDLSTLISAETAPGTATQGKVKISNISVTRGTNSATISWSTDVATGTNYVDWSEETPYTNRATAAAGGKTHSVTLSGLQPNVQYHYRVVSKTPGKLDSYSRDFVFVTDPDQPNMLENPGFETGSLAPWTKFTIFGGDAGMRNYPWTISGEPSWLGFQAHLSNWFYGSICNGSDKNLGGVYQRVPATPGDVLQLRGWVITWQSDPFPASRDYCSLARVGIDPTGGTDARSSSVIWGPWVAAQDIVGAVEDGTGKGSWTEAYVRASAAADHVTCFFEGGLEPRPGNNGTIRWVNWGFDDAVLTKVTAQPVERISDLAQVANGTIVRLDNKIVTALATEVGANYVEEPNVAALRVESASEFTRGHSVAVQGRKGTMPSGEPYLYEAVIVSDTPSTELRGLTTQAKHIGSTVGINTVGMLMQAVGAVTSDLNDNYYLNDGSLPAPGLKIRVSNLGFPPYVGDLYSITGIVQLEGTAPNTTPVLCPRDVGDVAYWGAPWSW